MVHPTPVLENKEQSNQNVTLPLLGSGNFGEVHRAMIENRLVAVKTVRDETTFQRELNILQGLNHQNVIKLLDTGLKNHSNVLVLELLDSDLLTLIRSNWVRLSDHQMVKVALQVAQGMSYLISKGIIHRDLACRNVLIKRNQTDIEEVKICDFGLSVLLSPGEREVVCKEKYDTRISAPEAISSHLFSQKSDVWSFGMLLYELFSRGNQISAEQILAQKEVSAFPEGAMDLIRSCLQVDPGLRPSFSEICKKLSIIQENCGHTCSFVPPPVLYKLAPQTCDYV
jgi:serine/threonine protein kinase